MKTIFLLPIVIVLVLYIVLGVVVPDMRMASEVKQRSLEKDAVIADLDTRISEIAGFVQESENNVAAMDFLADFVPFDAREERLLNDISQFADRSGVFVTNFDMQGGQASGIDGDLSAQSAGVIEAVGSYDQMVAFTNSFYRIKRLYDIQSIDLSQVDSDGGVDSDVPVNQDFLTIKMNVAFPHIVNVPAVLPEDFEQRLSFEDVLQIQQATETTNPISGQPRERLNPFIP